jgi:hypothetical protein
MKKYFVFSNNKNLKEVLPNLIDHYKASIKLHDRFNSGNGKLTFRIEYPLVFDIQLIAFDEKELVSENLDGVVLNNDCSLKPEIVASLFSALVSKRGWIYTAKDFEKYLIWGDHLKEGAKNGNSLRRNEQ